MFKSRFRHNGYESSRLRRLSPATNVTLTNLVTNGDFSDGETGWTLAQNVEVIGEQFVTTGGLGYCSQFITAETGHDVIAFCKYNCTVGGSGTSFVLSDGTGMYDGRVIAISLARDGAWHTAYVRRTVVAGGTTLYFGSTSVGAVGTAYADDFMLIDLTDIDTALGREVTVDEMKIYMAQFENSWFNGSVVISV